MGAFLSIDAGKRILLIRFEGVVTDEVLLEGYRQVRLWFTENGYCGNVSDFSNVSSFEVTGRAVALLASKPPLVPERFVRILVAPQDEVYGLSRMFDTMGSETGNRVDIVRSIEEAYRLVNICEADFNAVERDLS